MRRERVEREEREETLYASSGSSNHQHSGRYLSRIHAYALTSEQRVRCVWSYADLPPIKVWHFLFKLPKRDPVNSKRIVACHQRAGNRVCKLHPAVDSFVRG